MDALKEVGTQVYEPIHHFFLDVPSESIGPLLPVLGKLRATPARIRSARRLTIVVD